MKHEEEFCKYCQKFKSPDVFVNDKGRRKCRSCLGKIRVAVQKLKETIHAKSATAVQTPKDQLKDSKQSAQHL